MRTDAERLDRAVGIGLFVRAQGRSRDDAMAWMRAEGIDEGSATVAWDLSAQKYRALLRRFARRDLTLAACIAGLAVVVAATSYLRAWGAMGYVIAIALFGLASYLARHVPIRLQGQPSRSDLEMQRWMRDRYPDLPVA